VLVRLVKMPPHLLSEVVMVALVAFGPLAPQHTMAAAAVVAVAIQEHPATVALAAAAEELQALQRLRLARQIQVAGAALEEGDQDRRRGQRVVLEL